jgi:L-threonylcarbamoyladenylate synthase
MDVIEQAVQVLSHDGLIVYPTETVYGLGADAFSDDAITKVYEAKGREFGKPISIAVSDFEMLAAVAEVDDRACLFIRKFLPGPVTVVLKAKRCIPDMLTGGTGMIGIRIPAHEIPVKIIERFDAPITATSANLAGAKEPTTLEECNVPYDFQIDGGKLPGTPSTVVDVRAGTVLRRGALAGEIETFLAAPG